MLDVNLLMQFGKHQTYTRAPETLEEALIDPDVLDFLNQNNITFTPPIDGLQIACVLGLIKYCLFLDIHIIGGRTLADALGIANNHSSMGFGRYERWLRSETLFEFYENTIPVLKMIKLHKLKINALTIVHDIVFKSSQLRGEDHNKTPFNRFAVRQAVLFNQDLSFIEKNITPEMVIEARKIADLTQKQSATLVYVDERTWQRWESGDRNMPRGLFKLYLMETKQVYC